MSRPRAGALPPHYVITDRRLAGGEDALVAAVRTALAALPEGGALVQLREKDLSGRRLMALARALRDVTAARGCALLINDRVDVAMAAGADGVHLPEDGLPIAEARALLGPAALIGVSTHSASAARRASAAGADLIVFGPVWPTPSKPGARGVGLDALAEAAAAARPTPLYALGGLVSPARAAAAHAAGAHGTAAIRAYLGTIVSF